MSQLPAPKVESSAIAEYVPFAAQEPIKLSVKIIRDLIAVPTRSGKVCDDRQAMKFLMLCRSRKLNPFEGDAFLIGYDTKDGPQFSLITAHQAFLKRAEMHPDYDGMESGVVVRTQNGRGPLEQHEGDFVDDGEVLVGAWATVYRKDRSHPTKRILKLSTFKKAFGRWNDDPAGMIVKCAEADALRSTFPTQLAGMYLEEEHGPKEIAATVTNGQEPSLPPPGKQRLRPERRPAVDAAVAPEAPAPEPEPEAQSDAMPPHGDAYEGPMQREDV